MGSVCVMTSQATPSSAKCEASTLPSRGAQSPEMDSLPLSTPWTPAHPGRPVALAGRNHGDQPEESSALPEPQRGPPLPHLTLRGPSLGSLAIASLGGLSCPESNRNQQGTGSRKRCAHTDWSWARIKPGSGFCVPHIIVRSPGDANLEWRPFPPGHTPPVSLCTLRRAHLHSFGWMGWVSPTSHTTPVAKRWGSREPVAGVKGTEFGLRGTGKPVPAVSRGGS